MIPYTCNEIRRLPATAVLQPVRAKPFLLAWSRWRRRHQAAAELSHYRRRGEQGLHPDHGKAKRHSPKINYEVLL
jgi:hypothetical protein